MKSDHNTEVLNSNLLLIHAQFPHVGRAIEMFWGYKEFPLYVNKLLSDNKGTRKGFPFDILSALITLQSLHDQLFPEHMIDDPDDWLSSQFGVE